MQSKLLKKRRQSTRHAPLPSGDLDANQRGRPLARHLGQHVRAQQLKARQTHPATRPARVVRSAVHLVEHVCVVFVVLVRLELVCLGHAGH